MLCYSRQWLLPISERKFSRFDHREWIQCPGLRSNHWIFCHLTPETKSWKKIRLDQQLQAQYCLSPRHSSCLTFCLSRWSLCRNKNVVKFSFAFFDCAKIWGDADSGAYACQARPPASNFKSEFKTLKSFGATKQGGSSSTHRAHQASIHCAQQMPISFTHSQLW